MVASGSGSGGNGGCGDGGGGDAGNHDDDDHGDYDDNDDDGDDDDYDDDDASHFYTVHSPKRSRFLHMSSADNPTKLHAIASPNARV